jgi:hypothetical protein
VAEARLKTKNALDAYNALVLGDSKDMKGDYKKLLNAQKDMNKTGSRRAQNSGGDG